MTTTWPETSPRQIRSGDVLTAAREACERSRQVRARSHEVLSRIVSEREARARAAGRRTDDGRLRSRLSISEFWWRYWALGGDAGVFDLDGFLAGVLALPGHDQVILFQALRERRLERSRSRSCEGRLTADELFRRADAHPRRAREAAAPEDD